MDYSQVEVDEMEEIGMVMNDKEDGKDGMIDVEMVKNWRQTVVIQPWG
jgi:hypothetical protein